MSKICFLTHGADGWGSVSFDQRALVCLSLKAQVMLIDDQPELIVRDLPSEVSNRLRVIELPLWTDYFTSSRSLWSHLQAEAPNWVSLSNPGLLVKYYQILRRARHTLGTQTQFVIHSGILTMTWRRRLLEAAASFALLGADRITCVSEYTRRYWQQKYFWTRWKTFEVIHNGIPLPDIQPRMPRAWLRVGFVGRMDREKDPLLYCQIARYAKVNRTSYEFHAYGEGPLEAVLRDEFDSVLFFHGQVADADAIYSNIDILVVTSPVENCPYVVLEAKSYGVPTVASAVGGLPEIIVHDEDGILCEQRNVESFLEGIQWIHKHYQEFNRHCLANRSRFSLEVHSHKMWDPLLR